MKINGKRYRYYDGSVRIVPVVPEPKPYLTPGQRWIVVIVVGILGGIIVRIIAQ